MTNVATIDTTSLNLNADQIEAMTQAVKSSFNINALEGLARNAAMKRISINEIWDAATAIRCGKRVKLSSLIILFGALQLTSMSVSQVDKIASTGVLKAIRPVTSNL
jgi:hypothetical protein